MTTAFPFLSPVDWKANNFVIQRAFELCGSLSLTHGTGLRFRKQLSMHNSVVDDIYFPSKYIPLIPHRATPLLKIPISKAKKTPPLLHDQPFVHLVDDNVFVRRTLDPSQPHMGSEDIPNDSGILEVLCLAVVTRTCGNQLLFETAVLELLGEGLPHSVILLVSKGILSLHYIDSEYASLQFVLHNIHNIPLSLRSALEIFLGWAQNFVGIDALYPSPSYDREWVYDVIRRRPSDNDNDECHQYMSRVEEVSSLNITLRPYQKRAVAWMLYREIAPPLPLFGKETEWSSDCSLALIRDLETTGNIRASMKVETSLAFHPASASMWFGESEQKERFGIRIGHGGLLCDQMGLGKTVELLQLILCNKVGSEFCNNHSLFSRFADTLENGHLTCAICDHHGGQFISASCTECERPIHRSCSDRISRSRSTILCQICSEQLSLWSQASTNPIDLPRSKATLIIVPTTLLLQWKSEMVKHVKTSFTIVVYEGLKKSGYIRLNSLINADVVLSTYDALRADVKTAESLRRPRRNMRYARQYFPTPISLLTIQWHRLALDESQMLGTSLNTTALTMAGLIHAKRRWCVTGTPVSTTLDRSTAMFSILRQSNNENIDWSQLCRPSAYVEGRKWVAATLRKVMWRTVMSDVEQTELDLPPQITETLRVQFGRIERFHYQSLQGDIVLRMGVLRRSNVDRANTLSRALLIALRQACCHPLIGSSGQRLLQAAARQPRRGETESDPRKNRECSDMMTVLDITISKTQTEFQEALRSLIGSLNGLAGIALIHYETGKLPVNRAKSLYSAINFYREALQMAENARKYSEIDAIQKMHILFNIHEATSFVAKEKTTLDPNDRNHADALKILGELGRTPREGSVKSEFDSLRQKYLTDASLFLQSSSVDHQMLVSSLGKYPLIDYDTSSDKSDSDSENDGSDVLCEDADDTSEIPENKCKTDEICQEISGKNKLNNGNCNENARPSLKLSHACKVTDNESCGNRYLVSPSSTNSIAEAMRKGESGTNSLESDKLILRTSPKRRRYRRVNWWELAMACIVEDNQQGIFLERLENSLHGKSQNGATSSAISKVKNFMSLASSIQTELSNLQKARIRLNEVLKELPGAREPSNHEIAESGACSICRECGVGPACAHCRSEHLILDVERKLYAMSDMSDITDDDIFYDNPGKNSKASRAEILIRRSWQTSKRVARTHGLRLQSDLEVLLLMLGGSLRGKPQNMTDSRRRTEQTKSKMFKKWLSRYEKIKVELAKAKQVFEAQRALLAGMDEVKMAQTRLSLQNSKGGSCDTESRCRLVRSEIPVIELRFKVENAKMLTDLNNCRGRLSYLHCLRSDMEESNSKKRKNSSIGDHCIICLVSFQEDGRIGVLQCGHFYCVQCITALTRDKKNGWCTKFECPTCRHSSNRSDVVFTTFGTQPSSKRAKVESHSQANVDKSKDKRREASASDQIDANSSIENNRVTTDCPVSRELNDTRIRDVAKNEKGPRRRGELASTFVDRNAVVYGSVGCKANATICLLRGIWQRNGLSKIIIFSEWVEVLDMLYRALLSNMISVWNGSSVIDSKKFGKLISEFRQAKYGLALLLPLKRAGAGLNLTEAQHVILVEPSMDIALERQAVGRVHRIGQKNVTYVHRIIVEDTVEDDILTLGDEYREGPSLNAKIEPQDVIEKFYTTTQTYESIDEGDENIDSELAH